jgi:hypothetical protein
VKNLGEKTNADQLTSVDDPFHVFSQQFQQKFLGKIYTKENKEESHI